MYMLKNDTDASVFRNKEKSVEDGTNEDNCTIINTLEVIDSAYDDPDINSYHSKEEGDITPIDSKNYTT